MRERRGRRARPLNVPEGQVLHEMRRNGRLVATLRCDVQRRTRTNWASWRRSRRQTSSRKTNNVNDLEVTAGGRTVKLDERTAEHVAVGAAVSAVFSTDDADGVITPPATAVKLKLHNVDRWVRSGEREPGR